MAIYKATWTDREGTHEGFPYHDNAGPAMAEARLHLKGSRAVTILRDSEGKDHPENAGKFFIYYIVK